MLKRYSYHGHLCEVILNYQDIINALNLYGIRDAYVHLYYTDARKRHV